MHRKHFGAVFLSVFCLMTQFTAVAAERAALIKGSIVNIRSEANVNSKKVANLFSNTNVTVGDSVKTAMENRGIPLHFLPERAMFVPTLLNFRYSISEMNSLKMI